MTKDDLAALFTEWKKRYDADPQSFVDCEAFGSTPPDNYGEAAAIYFLWLKDQPW